MHAQGMEGVTVADKFITAEKDNVQITYDDFAATRIPAKVTFTDGTAKTIHLDIPRLQLNCK